MESYMLGVAPPRVPVTTRMTLYTFLGSGIPNKTFKKPLESWEGPHTTYVFGLLVVFWRFLDFFKMSHEMGGMNWGPR